MEKDQRVLSGKKSNINNDPQEKPKHIPNQKADTAANRRHTISDFLRPCHPFIVLRLKTMKPLKSLI